MPKLKPLNKPDYAKLRTHWVCADGRTLLPKDMDTHHILSTLLMLTRWTARDKRLLPYPTFQGEMAQYYAEAEWIAAMDAPPGKFYPIYDVLMAELARRGKEKTNG